MHKLTSVRGPTEWETLNAASTEFSGSAVRDWFDGLAPEGEAASMHPDALKLMLLKHAISKIKKERKAKGKGKGKVPA